MKLVPDAEIEARRELVADLVAQGKLEARRSPRNPTRMTVTESEPALLTREPLAGHIDGNALLLLLDTAQQIIVWVVGALFETRLQQDIRKEWPGALAHLNEHPDEGMILVYTYSRSRKPDLADYVLTGRDNRPLTYHGIDLYYAGSAEAAYRRYLTSWPMYAVSDEDEYFRVFQWFSASGSYRYVPPQFE
jgi:hypothetical protein